MSASENGQRTKFFFSNDGDRPYVTTYVQKPEFHVGDKVYLLKSDGSRDGPYEIASLPSAGRCTLSFGNGQPVKSGEEIEMDRVEAA